MFLTGLSEYADVFLPVTGFLENEGHYMTAEGKIKKLRKTVSAQGKSKTIPAILSYIAAVINEPLFPNARQGTIWKEIRSSLQMTVRTSAVKQNKFLSMKPGAGKGSENRTGIPVSRYNHFRYRGNDLISLVPDLKAAVSSIMDENIYHG
jgi:anaerobic selenocysteine-containing dehydrogenase